MFLSIPKSEPGCLIEGNDTVDFEWRSLCSYPDGFDADEDVDVDVDADVDANVDVNDMGN